MSNAEIVELDEHKSIQIGRKIQNSEIIFYESLGEVIDDTNLSESLFAVSFDRSITDFGNRIFIIEDLLVRFFVQQHRSLLFDMCAVDESVGIILASVENEPNDLLQVDIDFLIFDTVQNYLY